MLPSASSGVWHQYLSVGCPSLDPPYSILPQPEQSLQPGLSQVAKSYLQICTLLANHSPDQDILKACDTLPVQHHGRLISVQYPC